MELGGQLCAYRAFRNCLLLPYSKGRRLNLQGTPARAREEAASPGSGGIFNVILELQAEELWLAPLTLALTFLLWVLWNWWKEGRRRAEKNGFNSLAARPANTASRGWRS